MNRLPQNKLGGGKKGGEEPTRPETRKIPLDAIRLDGDTQARTQTNDEHVNDICDAIIAGIEMPPVILFREDNAAGDTAYWIGDGHHRIRAAQKARRKEIAADVRPGGQREAILHACGANAEHLGLRRTNADKHRAVETLLRDVHGDCLPGRHACGSRPREAQCWSTWPANAIAKQCGVSQPFVAKIKDELFPSSNGLKMDSTVNVKRGNSTYTQNTANIGKNTRPHEQERRRTIDRSVSQDAGYEAEPASPVRFPEPGPMPRRPDPPVTDVVSRDLTRLLTAWDNACEQAHIQFLAIVPSQGQQAANQGDLELLADAIAEYLKKYPAAMTNWRDWFRPEAEAVGHLPIGMLVRAIVARVTEGD